MAPEGIESWVACRAKHDKRNARDVERSQEGFVLLNHLLASVKDDLHEASNLVMKSWNAMRSIRVSDSAAVMWCSLKFFMPCATLPTKEGCCKSRIVRSLHPGGLMHTLSCHHERRNVGQATN
jgi:hypothetical protein